MTRVSMTCTVPADDPGETHEDGMEERKAVLQLDWNYSDESSGYDALPRFFVKSIRNTMKTTVRLVTQKA